MDNAVIIQNLRWDNIYLKAALKGDREGMAFAIADKKNEKDSPSPEKPQDAV